MKSFDADSRKLANRKLIDQLFRVLCLLAAGMVVVVLVILIGTICGSATKSLTLETGLPRLVNDTGTSRYDGVTCENRPRIGILQGTGPAGSTATIYAEDETGKQRAVGSGLPRGDGSFSITCEELVDGGYRIWFVITDSDGNELETSRPIRILIDTLPPAGLEFDVSTLGNRILVEGELGSFVVGGRGIEQNARVELKFQDDQGNSLGPIEAKIKQGSGWRIPKTNLQRLDTRPASKKQQGTLTVTATQHDLAGNAQPDVSIDLKLDRSGAGQADLVNTFEDDRIDLSALEIETLRPTNLGTFLTSHHYDNAPEVSGIFRALVGSMFLCIVCAMFTIPIGIGTAIFLEDFRPKNRILRLFHSFVQLNISNLAGVPSIVYGILGVTAFVYMFNLFPARTVDSRPKYEFGTNYFYQLETLGGQYVTIPCTDKQKTTIELTEPITAYGDEGEFTLNVVDSSSGLSEDERYATVRRGKKASIVDSEHHWYYLSVPFGKSFLAAGLTLGLVVLPIIIIASQEAIRGVPNSLREASMGMGATKWQTVRNIVLPSATPGIMTGTILALSRAVGEAAPILAVMGGVLAVIPKNLMENSSAMPILIYKWAKDASRGFHSLSAAAIVVLLLLLLAMNSVAIVIRYRAERKGK